MSLRFTHHMSRAKVTDISVGDLEKKKYSKREWQIKSFSFPLPVTFPEGEAKVRTWCISVRESLTAHIIIVAPFIGAFLGISHRNPTKKHTYTPWLVFRICFQLSHSILRPFRLLIKSIPMVVTAAAASDTTLTNNNRTHEQMCVCYYISNKILSVNYDHAYTSV